MSASEKRIENQIKSYLDSLNAYYLKVHGSMYQPAGTPDILACVNGRFIAIEVKREKGGVVSELQKSKIRKINSAGGIAFVARNVDEVSTMLKHENVI